ncbi:competence protein ComGF [Geomicrobium halophilum]|uniref:Competence protein ComGF n=1 Tax=Geomicrobium halophilum TaxID=549000 RepID=A0A841PJD9_9BACL|nr:competence type IV pilus minor pilin ComGF [Geomicrobium halophilum]MBB6448890.1 competence protein ComGF [Geomicrobium halophilum]
MSRVSIINDRGFTLLETVISMFILFAVVAVLPLFLHSTKPPDSALSHNEQEIHIWFQEMERESKYARDYSVEQNALVITDIQDTKRLYRKAGDRLIYRTVDGGHVIVLQSIEDFRAQPVEDGVVITVIADGKQYEKKLRHSQAPEEEEIWIRREL